MLFPEIYLSILQRICIQVLKCGPIPEHIAIIMDGNRRYAKRNRFDSVIDGHTSGKEKLKITCQWCQLIGIKQLTVYAFSTENFKRSQHEVEGLMDILRQFLKEFSDEKSEVNKRGIGLKVFGDITLLPLDIQKSIACVIHDTKHNNKLTVNMCLAYTARQEIADAFNELRECVSKKLIKPNDINETLLSKFLYTSHTPEPDLLIRTSGEHRLSDFMLWQCSFTVMAFIDTFWPQFSIWNLFYAVFYYQLYCSDTIVAKQQYEIICEQLEESETVEQFILDGTASDNFEAFKLKKFLRIKQCLIFLVNKRVNKLEELRKENL